MNYRYFEVLREIQHLATEAMIKDQDSSATTAFADITELINAARDGAAGVRALPLPGCPSLMPAKVIVHDEPAAEVPQSEEVRSDWFRKHTMDFGRFHVTRAAIPGRTILTFRRKQAVDAEHGSVIPGRIIVAKIFKADVVSGKVVHTFVVKSYEAGEKPRVLLNGDSHVSMSKTEKMVYKMVKCSIKETQRRCIMRKRSRAAKRAAAAKGVK